MDKNFKPVYVRGTETGKGVIEALIAYGGINNCDYKGNCESNIYYIAPNTNFICVVDEYGQFAPYITATAEEVKPVRWRAEPYDHYYTIDSILDVIESTEYGDIYDDGRYNSGNYYRTKEEAEKAAKKVKKILLS